jgi:hypothetical protein
MLEINLKEGTEIKAKVVNWDDTVDNITIIETPYGTCIVRDGDNQLEYINDFNVEAKNTDGGVELILTLKEPEFMVRFKEAWNMAARRLEIEREFKKGRNIRPRINIMRNGDTCSVHKEDLKIVDVEGIYGENGYVTVRVMLEDSSIEDIFGFFSDEIYMSSYEILGKTLKEAEEVRHEKDVAYIRS